MRASKKTLAQDVTTEVKAPRAPTDVVAALIWRDDTVLVQKRLPEKPLGGLWELPGGKVQVGEAYADALRRECVEELGVDIQVGELRWSTVHRGKGLDVRLRIYDAWIKDATSPQCLAASAQLWLPVANLLPLTFCPADRELIEALVAGKLLPTPRPEMSRFPKSLASA